jgi:hypothetical protein
MSLEDSGLVVGTLPPEWGTGPGLTSLRILQLANTGLAGPLPPEWCSGTGLASLQMLSLLNVPAVNSSIPLECVRGPGLAQLKELRLGYNTPEAAWVSAGQESTPLLPELGRLRSLQRLFVQFWQVSTVNVTLPPEWAANDTGLSALTSLYITGPGLVGSLPPEWGTWTGLAAVNHISVTRTRLNGTLPATWPDQLGWLPNFLSIKLEGNYGLGGTIPSEWSAFGGRLHSLYLGDSNVTGTLPCSFTQLTVLGQAYFQNRNEDLVSCDLPPGEGDVTGRAMVDNSSSSDASDLEGESTRT